MIFKRFLIALAGLIVFYPFLSTSVYAQAKLEDLNTVFENVIQWVAIIGGFLAFIALIIGGFKYMTARGDPKAISGAQNTITWAIIGLALIIIAYLLLRFISDFTDINVTEFNITNPFAD